MAAAEMAYIIIQAAQGEPSHFNMSTPFHAFMYSLMGFGASVLVGACAWMGARILWWRGFADAWVVAAAVGLILTCVLGGGFGGYLGSQMGHWVGGTLSDANGLPLFNWSRDGGDLRVAHFFGMHAMQVLPVAAMLIPTRWAHTTRLIVVAALACLYTGLTTATFVQALAGTPFI